MTCIICQNEVDWNEVVRDFEHLIDRADRLGLESLTEYEQTVLEGKCCSKDCYRQLH